MFLWLQNHGVSGVPALLFLSLYTTSWFILASLVKLAQKKIYGGARWGKWTGAVYRGTFFWFQGKHLFCCGSSGFQCEGWGVGKNNFLPKRVPQKIIRLFTRWMRPGQHGCLSVFKVTLGCCITLGLDSTTLEHPFPGLKPNSLDISQGTCREDLGFREVRTYFTCVQRRRWLGRQVRWSCSISWPWLATSPGLRTRPETHEQSSQAHLMSGTPARGTSCWHGQEPGLYVRGRGALWLHCLSHDGIFWKKPRHGKL